MNGKLFRKYAVLFVTLVTGALLANGLIEIYFSYQENKGLKNIPQKTEVQYFLMARSGRK